MREFTDKERIDAFELWASEGSCPNLLNDDNGHWAVEFEGHQTMPLGDDPQDIGAHFFVRAARWHKSIREAIDAAIIEEETPSEIFDTPEALIKALEE